jgi:uncharacterized protein (DUF305 family)
LRAHADPRATRVLTTAHHLLQKRMSGLEGDEMRRLFLEGVASHHETAVEFAEQQADPG